MRLIDGWKSEIKRLWSLQLTLLLFAVNGLFLVLPAFVGVISPWVLAAVSMVLAVAIGIARLLKQPGAEI